MKQRGIMFQGPLVRAILEGNKTQTRRLVNMEKLRVMLPKRVSSDYEALLGGPSAARGRYAIDMNPNGAVCVRVGKQKLGVKPGEFHFVCPYADGATRIVHGTWRVDVEPDQRLYVKETWAKLTGNGIRTVYRADSEDPRTGWDDTPPAQRPPMKWNSAMFMPRHESRITLAVTAVRMERLQSITEDDARAEGVPAAWLDVNGKDVNAHSPPTFRQGFARTWEQINGVGSWQSNPWTWVVEFRRLQWRTERETMSA